MEVSIHRAYYLYGREKCATHWGVFVVHFFPDDRHFKRIFGSKQQDLPADCRGQWVVPSHGRARVSTELLGGMSNDTWEERGDRENHSARCLK
jgi:hypothetical protein